MDFSASLDEVRYRKSSFFMKFYSTGNLSPKNLFKFPVIFKDRKINLREHQRNWLTFPESQLLNGRARISTQIPAFFPVRL